MIKFTDRPITAKYIEDDVWLSRQTIKDMLNTDLAEIEKSGLKAENVLAISKYIRSLVSRLNRIGI